MIPLPKKIYYGWWIVAGAILCQFVSVSVGQVTVGILLQPVTADLGWPVWQYTLGPALALGIGALSGPFVGPIIDRTGPRRLILLGALVSACSFYLLGQQSTLWAYLGLHIAAGVIGWNLFGPLVINATIIKWFVHKRGWALAIGSVGVSMAGLLTPVVVTNIVDGSGWRTGYITLALFVLIVVAPIGLIMRRSPEDYGLLPDGIAREAVERDSIQPRESTITEKQLPQLSLTRQSLTGAEALGTHSFWLLALGFGCNLAALNAVLVHAIPFVTTADFSRSTAALALTVNGLGNLISKAVWGYTLQRVAPRTLVLAAFSTSALGVATMMVAASTGSTALLFLGFFCYGFGFGGTIPLSEYLWATYFGRVHIGTIRGMSQPITILGPMLGPILVGLWYDIAQSYALAFLTIIGVYLTGAMLIGISREPVLRDSIQEV